MTDPILSGFGSAPVKGEGQAVTYGGNDVNPLKARHIVEFESPEAQLIEEEDND